MEKNEFAYICACRKDDQTKIYAYRYEKGIGLNLSRDFTKLLENVFMGTNWNLFVLWSLDGIEGEVQMVMTLIELGCLVLEK